jgi:diaphanous 1
LGLVGDKRLAMYNMPDHKKATLLEQHFNSQLKASSANRSSHYAASYGPSSASALLPRLVPQLTGDSSIMKRLSIASWTTPVEPPPQPQGLHRSPTHSPRTSIDGTHRVGEIQPLQPQSTGSLWSSWWASSGGENGPAPSQPSQDVHSIKQYLEPLRRKRLDHRFVKDMIALRVHLSTAQLSWVEDFTDVEGGINLLESILTSLVGKGGKRKQLNDAESSALLELMKCFRVLLNIRVR